MYSGKQNTFYTANERHCNVCAKVPNQNGNWTTRGYANSRSGHLVDWSTRGLENSRTSQLADWTTRGLADAAKQEN